MILQSLSRYYEILASDPDSEIAPPAYSKAPVSFALVLSAHGELINIIPLFQNMVFGKKTVEKSRRMIVPEQVKRSSKISPNMLCDNSAYVLGISKENPKDPKYASKRFEEFRKVNLAFLEKIDCLEARALIGFLETHNPAAAREHPAISPYFDRIIESDNLVFNVEGSTGFLHEVPQIKNAWEHHRAQVTNALMSQCLVSGELAPIARLHANIKGVVGGNPSGTALVGFNARAYESFNRVEGQGINSPVGEQSAFAYTTALNYLLSNENPNRKFTIGDTTVVYWAESQNSQYAARFAGLFGITSEDAAPALEEHAPGRDRTAEERLKQVAGKVRLGRALDPAKIMEGLDGETRFYVLGLAPNAGRVSVRFFHADPFEKIVQKIMAHYEDLQIQPEYSNQPEMISIRQIMDETVSKKSSDRKGSPLLGGALLRSILNNLPYPAALYYAIINRVRADMDDSSARISKINYTRAAVIKAFLTRKYRNQNQPLIKEVLCMSLNEQSTHKAYLLGRLFAVLEKAQQDAAGNVKLNATIKDRYFTSACASPATVFPVLLRLSQHHISKADYGYVNDKRIEEILNQLDMAHHPIPSHLNLDEQGIFILGYYHQRAALYKPGKNAANHQEEFTFN